MDIYEINKLPELLKKTDYQGRGIIIGATPDGKKAAAAYFIMGRSANSRNRVFVEKKSPVASEKDPEVFTEPFDASKVEDPSLIIYAAIRQYQNKLIVTNGDQTDTIYEGLASGKSFSESLEVRQFEPDAPNLTPRISGMLTFKGAPFSSKGQMLREAGNFSYQMSILKSIDPEGSDCARYTFSYPAKPGLGHFIHTYVENGNPLPTFQGEPERVAIANDIDEFAAQIWDNLDAANGISLYVRFVDLETGKAENRLFNRNK